MYDKNEILYVEIENLKKIRYIQKRLLKIFIDVCKKENLQYFLTYGTLLGAIRHNGFIPWDDDVDVAMPRKDYDLLINNADNWFPDFCFLQTPMSERACFYGGYAKLRDNSNLYIEEFNWNQNCHHGVWIDILPIDNWNNNECERKRQWKRIHFIQSLLYVKCYSNKTSFTNRITKNEWAKLRKVAQKFSHEELIAYLDNSMQLVKDADADSYAILARYYSGFRDITSIMLRDHQERFINTKFEDFECVIPQNYEEHLKLFYGNEYMMLPPIEYRRAKHKGIFVENMPYYEFIKKARRPFPNEEQTIKKFMGGFSSIHYDKQTGRVEAKGWCLPKVEKVEVWVNEVKIGLAKVGIERKDVYLNYLEYDELLSGWSFSYYIGIDKKILWVKYIFPNSYQFIEKRILCED